MSKDQIEHASAPTRRRSALLLAVLMMAVMLMHGIVSGASSMWNADLPNPDSYFKLVLLQDHTAPGNLGFAPRDNAPSGTWVHWSLPHSWVIWQLHRVLTVMGIDQHSALLWTGASLTVACMLLLSALLALTVMTSGTQRGALAASLVLASSIPLLAYGRFDQITHHIFMLVPLAGASACLLRVDATPAVAFMGGALLGLALWISPETMPFIAGLVCVRAGIRLQNPGSAAISLSVAGLGISVLCGWLLDPPPPGFSRWALDHVSLAWLLFAGLMGALGLLADFCVGRRVPLPAALFTLTMAAAAAGWGWLMLTPGAWAGPAGLIPAELKPLWWDHINELQPADEPANFVAYFAIPLCGALTAAYAGVRDRKLGLLALAGMALTYGLLGVWHTRMGAAATLAGAIAFGSGVSRLRAFADTGGLRFTPMQQAGAFLLTLAGPLQLGASLGLAELSPQKISALECPLAPVASALNALPAATILAPVFSGPELLYRTHHRVIAGPYHHNVEGILDNYRAWLDTGTDEAKAIVQRRDIEYVLACTDYQSQLMAKPPARSLAQRAASGDVPDWLEAVPWPRGAETAWRLYKVRTP